MPRWSPGFGIWRDPISYPVSNHGSQANLLYSLKKCNATCFFLSPFFFFLVGMWGGGGGGGDGQIFLRYNCVPLWVTGNIQLLSKPLWDQGEYIEQSPPSSDQIQGGKALWHGWALSVIPDSGWVIDS